MLLTMPQPFECRWIKRMDGVTRKHILQQYLYNQKGPAGTGRNSCEWADVPVEGKDMGTTVSMRPSGPQTVVTAAEGALEPRLRTPEELEDLIEQMVTAAAELMRARVDASDFYEGSIILVHGTGRQRLLINGEARVLDAGVHVKVPADLHQLALSSTKLVDDTPPTGSKT